MDAAAKNAVRKVLVGIPSRQPLVTTTTMGSVVTGVYEMGMKNTVLDLFFWTGDPLISHARNVVLAHFLLETDCDDLLFVDDDVSWAPGMLTRLLNPPVDLVAGCYRHKKPEESYPINWIPNDTGMILTNEFGLIEVRDVPMGFCRISRACAQQMYDAAADKPFKHRNAPNLECRVVFDIPYEDGELFGEDFDFCRKWRALGGKVWVDAEMAVNHTGFMTFDGHLGNWLRAGGPTPKQTDPASVVRDGLAQVAQFLGAREAA